MRSGREENRIDYIQEVMETLAVLEPRPGDDPVAAAQALARIKARAVEEPVAKPFWMKETGNMLRRRVTVATALLVFVVGLVMLSPTVRAAASDFLGLFRVQKFAPR